MEKIIQTMKMYYVEPKESENVGYYYIVCNFVDRSKEYFYPFHFEHVLTQKFLLAFRQMMVDNEFIAFTDAKIDYSVVTEDDGKKIIINSIVFHDELGLIDLFVEKALSLMF